MTRFEAWCVHLSSILVAGTGLVYAWMLYLAEPVDPYAVVNHPWQPMLQHLHVWVAPLLVFGTGLIWRNHVWQHWKQGVRPRRHSGLGLMLTVAPMVVSGYLIQTAVGEGWRTAWVVIHLITSAIWLLGYLAHLISPTLRRRQAARRRRRQAEADAAEGLPAWTLSRLSDEPREP